MDTATTVVNAILVVIIALLVRYHKYVIRKVFWALGFPKLECHHPELGEYDVGALQVRLSPDTPLVQLFYPVDGLTRTRKNRQKISYFRPKAVAGLLRFMYANNMDGNIAEGILQFLQDASHPLLEQYGADPLPATKTDTKFPVVIFSHGLSGTMEMYTEICSQLASLGCVVVAVEHADASASYTTRVDEDGSIQDLWYQLPPSNSVEPYSRQKVVNFRGPKLQHRVQELTRVYQFLQSGKKVTYGNPADAALANAVLATTDPSELHLTGHSFGGATQLLAAQTWAMERAKKGGTIQTKSVTVLDAWNFGLSEEIVARGIPNVPGDPPGPKVLSVISEDWITSTEVFTLWNFLRNSRPHCAVDSYYSKGSMHQSFSDSEAWFPMALARATNCLGKTEPLHVTIRAVVREFSTMTGIGCGPKKDAPMEQLVPLSLDKMK